MIDFLEGKIISVQANLISLNSGKIGFELRVPDETIYLEGQDVSVAIYFHWNQEKGPTLFAFKEAVEKDIFLMIISCSGIGPKIALTVLRQMAVNNFLSAILEQNIAALSKVNGIGEKKAAAIILQLKDKVNKFILSNKNINQNTGVVKDIAQLNKTLLSLGYSDREISQSIEYAKKIVPINNRTFDTLLRVALTYFTK